MSRKTDPEIRKKIIKLYEDGFSYAEIAQQTGTKYHTVYGLTRFKEKLKEKGFNSKHEYVKSLLKNKDQSLSEYFKKIASDNSKKRKNIIFSEYLNDILKRTGMTQTKLARKLNVTDGTISKYVRGLSFPDQERLKGIVCNLESLL